MYDTYDFNAKGNYLIKAGRHEMIKGHLKSFFTIHDILIPNDILINEIWK